MMKMNPRCHNDVAPDGAGKTVWSGRLQRFCAYGATRQRPPSRRAQVKRLLKAVICRAAQVPEVLPGEGVGWQAKRRSGSSAQPNQKWLLSRDETDLWPVPSVFQNPCSSVSIFR